MALVAHLSDLHLQLSSRQEAIFDALVTALRVERERRAARFDLIAVTGDVFDDGSMDPKAAAQRYAELHARLDEALGGRIPTVIVPGNHDRRRLGLFSPHREELFEALAARLAEVGPHIRVHGCEAPFLASVIEPELTGLPLWIVAYDSTYLPRGLLSAGGMMRQEDLLHAAAIIGDREPDWPVLFLLHHHLVPTPLTDLHPVQVERAAAPVRWAVERALPFLVSHADREELTMTALGAGTAISTLHTLGRAVLVLHGHKHYATTRMLDGTVRGHGDVLIASAGSAGTAEEWLTPSRSGGTSRGAARLWPSFNVIELDQRRLTVETVSFGYKGRAAGVPARRPLVRAQRDGAQWLQEPIDEAEVVEPARLALNRARFRILATRGPDRSRWDYECEREVHLAPGAELGRYVDTIYAESDAVIEMVASRRHRGSLQMPVNIELDLGEVTRYRADGAVHRVLNGMHHAHADRHAPFSFVALMNRYASTEVVLELDGMGAMLDSVFASATDLGTGLERPLPVLRDAGRVVVRVENCPPRILLRAYWPLQRPAAGRLEGERRSALDARRLGHPRPVRA